MPTSGSPPLGAAELEASSAEAEAEPEPEVSGGPLGARAGAGV